MRNNRGIILIEMIVYIALFTIIMGGLFTAFFLLIKSGEKTGQNVATEEEINFVLKKIDWALSGVKTINLPTSGSDTKFSVNKNNFADNPVIIRLNSTSKKLELCTKVCLVDTDYSPLTSKNTMVDNFSVTYLAPSGGSPAGLSFNITMNGKIASIKRYLNI